jgi:hypothetical protein
MRNTNDINLRFRAKIGAEKMKWLLACLIAMMVLPLSLATAGSDMKEIAPPEVEKKACCGDKDWTVELGSGALWSNVRSGEPNQAYTIIPISFTASMKIDDVSLDNFAGGFLRGYTEFYFRGDYAQIVHGPENRYAGILVGPRYNFVQPGWCVVPFVEGGVGVDFADSRPDLGGLGQDFNFSFDVAVGAKFKINCDWFARLSCEYQHLSNAGLSEPTNPNHPIDALGPKLSFGYSF